MRRQFPRPTLDATEGSRFGSTRFRISVSQVLGRLFAMSAAPATYVIAICGCYPLVMYVLAVVMLKERVNWVRVIGIALIVCGGIVIQLTQAL